MSFKDEWKDLQDATPGMPNSGDDVSVKPINKIAHQVIANEENIINKVDKEDGKGLSTNDFTDEYKGKVDDLGEQAQSDWSQNDETAPDYIKNRTHYTEIVDGKEKIHKLDDKYIPNSIARVADVEEILDELHAYAQNLIGGDA